MRALALLALLLAGCVPIAVLRSPEPVQGHVFTVGGSVFPSSQGQYPVWAVPYLGYAGGNGFWELNLSVQGSPRVGGRLKLAPGLSLDGGLSLLLTSRGSVAFRDVDVGLILGVDRFYFSPRLHALAYGDRSDLAFQVSLGYWGEGWVLEAGYPGPYLALGLSFGTAL
ncbi:MAG: hypothetical protein ABWJ63_10340 [Thermus sp.]|uniref:Lipoprotein n=1 Tax=Thermus brevis TaxID=2862456 RepID=A0ABS6ZY97_9DEIN|nr:hypothetical protein [Thermus brevis]MBW6394055.1 hypothetical protein [Thermus brevis]